MAKRSESARSWATHAAEAYVMPFGDHLEDLRRRLTLSLMGLLPLFVVSFVFGRELLSFLMLPVQTQLRAAELPPALQSTGPFETFGAYMRVATIVTILAGAPWVLWQGWLFVRPGLYRHEKRFVNLLMPLSAVLTLSSAVFLYKLMLPVVLMFFIGFGADIGVPTTPVRPVPEGMVLPTLPSFDHDPEAPQAGQAWINTDLMQLRIATPNRQGKLEILGTALTRNAGIVPQFRISEYVRTVFSLAMAFAIGFQTPVVVLLLGWAGLAEPKTLTKNRKYVVFGCGIAGAFLTPADPLSMLMLAVPLYALFELGIVLMRIFPAEKVGAVEP